MAKKNKISTVSGPIDCACVIYGDTYSWKYVENLYNMLRRHLSAGVRLHVYTEAERSVPDPMIKHVLTSWGDLGHKRNWWYKMQLFNAEHHAGPLLYFDLDTVIVNNIDWIVQSPLEYFWAIRDFKYLWRPTHYGINSSIMWWDTSKFQHVWTGFSRQDFKSLLRKYHGDQDFITDAIPQLERRLLDANRIKSWRWQAFNGGYDFTGKTHRTPTSGTQIQYDTSVLVFHGEPKPDKLSDSVIAQHWQ